MACHRGAALASTGVGIELFEAVSGRQQVTAGIL